MQKKKNFSFSVLKEYSRIDQFLSELFTFQSRQFWKNLLEQEKILINGKSCKPSSKVLPRSKIEITYPEVLTSQLIPKNLNIPILYEDDDLVVVNKPAGMSVHPSPSDHAPTLVEGLLYQIKNLSGINGQERPGIVHRIDKNTTGLLVVAKNDQAHFKLAEQFEHHTIDRLYMGVCCGQFRKKIGTIKTKITRNEKNRLKFAVSEDRGKIAITHYKVIKEYKKNFSLVEFRLETGRTHQIRVHCHSLQHPIVNDAVYGNRSFEKRNFSPEAFQYLESVKFHFLHAKKLGFTHPRSEKLMSFEVPPPQEFEILERYLESE